MHEFLDLTIRAHGGIERWQQLETIRTTVDAGGILWVLKGQADLFERVDALADTRVQRVTFASITAEKWRGVFEPGRIRRHDYVAEVTGAGGAVPVRPPGVRHAPATTPCSTSPSSSTSGLEGYQLA